MKNPEEIAKALHLCYNPPSSCDDCPYDDCEDCVATVAKDAEECIRALVDERPRWIPVEERLPEKHRCVLVHLDFGMITTGVHNGREWWDASSVVNNETVTHWMPLLEPPKEE